VSFDTFLYAYAIRIRATFEKFALMNQNIFIAQRLANVKKINVSFDTFLYAYAIRIRATFEKYALMNQNIFIASGSVFQSNARTSIVSEDCFFFWY